RKSLALGRILKPLLDSSKTNSRRLGSRRQALASIRSILPVRESNEAAIPEYGLNSPTLKRSKFSTRRESPSCIDSASFTVSPRIAFCALSVPRVASRTMSEPPQAVKVLAPIDSTVMPQGRRVRLSALLALQRRVTNSPALGLAGSDVNSSTTGFDNLES